MGRSSYDAIERWSDIVHGRTEKSPIRCTNIVVSRDRVYSYGTHFELARALRDSKGKITAYLLNGDRYSNTTSGHQSQVRQVLAKEDAEQVIIPYSALESAGIDRDTVRLIHRLEDRWVTTQHHCTEMPQGAVWKYEAVHGQVPCTPEEIEERMRTYGYSRRGMQVPEWVKTKDAVVGHQNVLRTSGHKYAHEIEVSKDDAGVTHYRWETGRHHLGESLIRARTSYRTNHRCTDCGGFGTGPRVMEHGYRWELACSTCSGRGETTKTHHRWAYYLSGFDHQEARELYFFCELPYGCKPATVDEAYEVLKPDPVKLAEQMGRTIFRQGDIFGIPLADVTDKTLRAAGAVIEERVTVNSPKPGICLPYLLNTNHTATKVARMPNGVTLAKGMMYHDPSFRDPDHARRKLGDGKTWHAVVKNTVPVTEGRR